MAVRIASSLKNASLGSTKTYCRTVLNPRSSFIDVTQSLNDLKSTKKLDFEPKSLLLFSTPQYSKQLVSKLVDLKESSMDLQILYASVDCIAPFSSRNGISELWLSNRMSIPTSRSIEEVKSEQENTPASKPGRIISTKSDEHWDLSSNSNLSLNVPFIPRNLMHHHSLPQTLTKIKFQLGSTIFHNSDLFTTCFYFVSQKERKTLSRLDMKTFDYIKHYLDNDGKYLHDLEVALPPLILPSRNLSMDNYNNLKPIDLGDDLRISELTGNLVRKINGKPASSVIQDDKKLMSQMNKDSRIYVTIENDDEEEMRRRFEVIAGGGAWGAKADTLAIDPEALEFMRVGTKLSFFLYQTGEKSLKQENEEKMKIFFPEGLDSCNGVLAEKSGPQEGYNADSGIAEGDATMILENVFAFGSEKKLTVNDINHDSDGEVIRFRV
ncbi:hypothetical protein DASC09_031450 [Saccharomycopsis crataegensis]|uniref:FIST domain-containing protein n=1 Tax=Saccharomycopsis crataegensis TaxID=43959 RepID=A0AAV5QMR2_9ASCO|nr:hypothetical protein DASC09_031450 [Saccharomycopsis crataegensis]